MFSQSPAKHYKCSSPCNMIPKTHDRASGRTVVRDRRPVNSADVMNSNSNNSKSERSCDRMHDRARSKLYKNLQKHYARNSGHFGSDYGDFQNPEASAFTRIQATLCR
ncbi:hypothetical protein HanPI659440_Chr04g0153431 [Helianthus annuus]|nr:hypothetical protein HanPI659440_Chr04g0153431 [Helianthus annuus]